MSDPTFMDLFSGAGGLSLGLSQAGWRCLLGIDNWPDAVATYRSNFHDHPVLLGDIESLSTATLAQSMADRPDWIVGGPPCQGFSTIGKRKRNDPRNRLVYEFRRVVRELRPEGFVIENVLGLKDMRFEAEIRHLFEQIGYRVSFHVLRAADYGVPQLRRRVVFVGHSQRGDAAAPRACCPESEYVTVRDAIGDLPRLGPGEAARTYSQPPASAYQERMREGSSVLQGHIASNHPPALVKAISFIPDGGNRRAIPDELQPKSGFHNSYSRLASDRPAVAVSL